MADWLILESANPDSTGIRHFKSHSGIFPQIHIQSLKAKLLNRIRVETSNHSELLL